MLFGAVFVIGAVEIRTVVDIREDVDIILLGRDVLQHTSLNLLENRNGYSDHK
jgi:hypothetical protein